jgi:DNA-binding LacI/PurR family transcriptional regulator
LGLKSIEILNKIIKKGKIEDNKVFIPHELVVRESTNKLNELTTNQEVIMNNNM